MERPRGNAHGNAESTAPLTSRLFADSTLFRWQNQTLRGDVILVIPIAICLAAGLATGHPAAGMIAAGGAVNTGFGTKQCIQRSMLLPMIFVTFGMAFSGFVGVLLGHENLLLVFVSALWAFGYGMLTGRPGGYGWVGQQCVITFLVASAFPASVARGFRARIAPVRRRRSAACLLLPCLSSARRSARAALHPEPVYPR